MPVCGADFGVAVTLRNVGTASLAAGVAVGVFDDHDALLGTVTTTVVLYGAQAQLLTLVLPDAGPGIVSGATKVYAQIDAATLTALGVVQCRTDNDRSPDVSLACAAPR